jgi:hypothetical protein
LVSCRQNITQLLSSIFALTAFLLSSEFKPLMFQLRMFQDSYCGRPGCDLQNGGEGWDWTH